MSVFQNAGGDLKPKRVVELSSFAFRLVVVKRNPKIL